MPTIELPEAGMHSTMVQQELAQVMAGRTLLDQQKRMLALAVAALRGAPSEVVAQTRALQREHGMSSGQIVEVVATIAHTTGINLFERAMATFDDAPPMRALDHATPVVQEVRSRLGSVPRYFRCMANDPDYCRLILHREISTVHEGEVSRVNKELVAYGTSLVNDARYSIGQRAETLRSLGMTNAQLFEATVAVSIFMKSAAFSTGLQLEPTVV